MAQGQKKGSRRIRHDGKLRKLVRKDQHRSYWALLVVEEVKEEKERTGFGRKRKEKDLVRPREQGMKRRIVGD